MVFILSAWYLDLSKVISSVFFLKFWYTNGGINVVINLLDFYRNLYRTTIWLPWGTVERRDTASLIAIVTVISRPKWWLHSQQCATQVSTHLGGFKGLPIQACSCLGHQVTQGYAIRSHRDQATPLNGVAWIVNRVYWFTLIL